MASRNQNRPPRSPSNMQKKGGTEELPSDKRQKIGPHKVERQGRARVPLGALNNKTDANDVGGADESECNTVDFTEADVEALLNERMKKGNPFDNKKKMEQMADLIKRLKLCVRWFKRVEEGYIQEKEKLQTDLECAEKKCIDTENEMKIRIAELNEAISNLRTTISSLEERITKEESDKLEAIELHRIEKKARYAAEQMQACLSTELEKVRDEKSAAERKAISNEDLYNRLQEYNMGLQQYNSCLQLDLKTIKKEHQRLEAEKTTIVENLSNVRGHNKALQDQLASLKASQDEATKQKEILANELKTLREELQQIRDDRDRQLGQVHALTEEAKYRL